MRRKVVRGATLLEGALTLLALFIFLFGIFEFGRAYNIYQTLTNAAREGARFAVAPCPSGATACPYGAGVLPSSTDVTAKVQSYLATANVSGATVTVTTDTIPVGAVATTFTHVNVQAPYSFIFFPFGSVTLSTQAVMRNETN